MLTPPEMFKLEPTGLPGLVLLRPRIYQDHRGSFVKAFHAQEFRKMGIAFEPKEEFYSISGKDVLRGMHFQIPPMAHAKLVYCTAGSVLDVVLDLRRNSPSYGRSFSCRLDGVNKQMLFVPVGFAHGFLALENDSVMIYKTDTEHAPQYDSGIAWNSFGFQWPVSAPILSGRDTGFPPFKDFESPF